MYLRTLDKGKTRIEEEFFLKITCFIFILVDYYLVREKKFLIALKTDYFQ